MEEGEVAESDLPSSAEPQTSPPGPAGEGRTWWVMDAPEEDKRSPCASPSGRFRWNFSAISFPDLGSGRPGSVAPPDPSLLPGGVKVGLCDVASWMQRINLRKVRMSAREEQMERRRRRRDVNKDRQVKASRQAAKRNISASLLVLIPPLSGSKLQKLGGIPRAAGPAAGHPTGPTGPPVERGS